MKLKINFPFHLFTSSVFWFICLLLTQANLYAQDSTTVAEELTSPPKVKPVKNTFRSVWIIDNQTVMVPIKGSFEMDIMHRFGTVKNGYADFWGFFAPSNMRLGASYAPINNLFLGFGITKDHMLWDGSAKYSILKQTNGKYPVSISYYGNMGMDTRKDPDNSIFRHASDRISSFNQLIIARKVNENFSVQIAPSVSHQNSVNSFYTKNDSTGTEIFREMKFDHFAMAVSGRYKISEVTCIIVNYDQPLTKHPTNNPNPNLSFGFEFASSGHAFQLFMGNYSMLSPQRNNLYNKNSPLDYTAADGTKVKGGQFVIGFNVTRLWNW